MGGLTAQGVSILSGVSIPTVSVALPATNVTLPSANVTLNRPPGGS